MLNGQRLTSLCQAELPWDSSSKGEDRNTPVFGVSLPKQEQTCRTGVWPVDKAYAYKETSLGINLE